MHEIAQRAFYPCATRDPRYDTAITRNRLRRSMHNNNNRLRRSSRSPVILFPFAVSALVSACQSVGPAQDAPAGSGSRRHGRSRSARADRAAGARVSRARRRARLARAPALAVCARDHARPRRATRTRLVCAQPGVPRPSLQARRTLSVPYRRRARGARHAGRARAAADRRKRVRSVRLFAWPRRGSVADHSRHRQTVGPRAELVVRRPPRRARVDARRARLPASTSTSSSTAIGCSPSRATTRAKATSRAR